MRPLVSVVVPTYKRPQLLSRCLSALVEQDFDRRGYEIVVTDDEANGSTRDLVGAFAAAVC